MGGGWSELRSEAASVRGRGRFTVRAYSEMMPPPYVGLKPTGEPDPVTPPAGDEFGWNVSEYEEAQELGPGLRRIAEVALGALGALARGERAPPHLSKTLLRNNPAWPAALSGRTASQGGEPLVAIIPLALSRTQDDKGRVRWTLFGGSHAGPARPFWRSFFDGPGRERPKEEALDAFRRLIAWATGTPEPALADLARAGVRVLPVGADADSPAFASEGLPGFARALLLDEGESADMGAVRTLVTFRPFERLPEAVRRAYLDGTLRLIPSPASLVFFGHRGYRKLARELPLAIQVPLLHLFPRSRADDAIRIPQSGWLEEIPDALQRTGGAADAGERHRIVARFRRTHRWQRIERDEEDTGDALFDDRVSVALFSTRPDDLGLYGKPMARNAQVWTEDYRRLLDGPRAGPEEIAAAERALAAGGRFGYRFFYPPMQVGARAVFWHRPLIARSVGDGGALVFEGGIDGFLTAEREGAAPIEFSPRLLRRPAPSIAATIFERDPGRRRLTTAGNARKLLEWRDLLEAPLAPSLALRLLHVSKDEGLEAWLARLPGRASDAAAGARLAEHLRGLIGPGLPLEAEAPLTFERTRAREFEERYWRTIADLCEGDLRDKNNADPVLANAGRTGGPLAATAGRTPAVSRQLDLLGDRLHRAYAELIERHAMSGRAVVADQTFSWETDFDFSWSAGWSKSRGGHAGERNIVVVIPGRRREEAVIMADHFDTAYMEDVYDPRRGGDRLRAAAAGADDNHSATAALLLAADVLLPLARAGALARDVWLVHLTGEEFPSDCLGARALAARLVERNLVLQAAPGGAPIDLSGTHVCGAFVLDMVAHNNDHDRDVFQIAPGEGRRSARLAWWTHLANERWNRAVKRWNAAPERRGRGRARRVEQGADPPPPAEHLALAGEIRPEWDPRSALYNTDGQIFSDLGIPVVLIMENYDIRRAGYHDTHDTMKNIDLDYGAALVAIAIEAVAAAASAPAL